MKSLANLKKQHVYVLILYTDTQTRKPLTAVLLAMLQQVLHIVSLKGP